MAHGPKTPLTVLSADAEELRARGDVQLAEDIESITAAMRRHVERELVRARTGPRVRSGPVHPVRPVAEQVVGVLRRTPHGQKLTCEIDAPDDLRVKMEAQDLTEILGNLAENATTWAAGTVSVEARRDGSTIMLRVEDDGPGVPEELINTALARGGRLDETRPGTGLGLAIVGDLVEDHGGSLSLGRSALGGLLAEGRLPHPP